MGLAGRMGLDQVLECVMREILFFGAVLAFVVAPSEGRAEAQYRTVLAITHQERLLDIVKSKETLSKAQCEAELPADEKNITELIKSTFGIDVKVKGSCILETGI